MIESKLVVDTNIFFSLLLRRDTALRRRFLTDTACTFHCPRFLLVQLFKYSVSERCRRRQRQCRVPARA